MPPYILLVRTQARAAVSTSIYLPQQGAGRTWLTAAPGSGRAEPSFLATGSGAFPRGTWFWEPEHTAPANLLHESRETPGGGQERSCHPLSPAFWTPRPRSHRARSLSQPALLLGASCLRGTSDPAMVGAGGGDSALKPNPCGVQASSSGAGGPAPEGILLAEEGKYISYE